MEHKGSEGEPDSAKAAYRAGQQAGLAERTARAAQEARDALRELDAASNRAMIRYIEVGVGVRVRNARESAGLSQQQLADALTERGMTMHQTTVAKLERASRPIRVSEVVLISMILGIPLSYLIGIDPIGDAVRMEDDNRAQIRGNLHELYRVQDFVRSRIKSVQDQIDSGSWIVKASSNDTAT